MKAVILALVLCFALVAAMPAPLKRLRSVAAAKAAALVEEEADVEDEVEAESEDEAEEEEGVEVGAPGDNFCYNHHNCPHDGAITPNEKNPKWTDTRGFSKSQCNGVQSAVAWGNGPAGSTIRMGNGATATATCENLK